MTIENPIIETLEADKYAQVSARIDADWYPLHTEEWFTQLDICTFFQWKEPSTRHAVSQKLYYDCHDRKPLLLEKQNKTYRVIDRTVEELDWQAADQNATLDLILPFDLHKHVKFYPKSIIVVAGASNAGKTAWMYNFILQNVGKYPITLYNSETSPEQMKQRFMNFDSELLRHLGISEGEIPNPPPFRTIERYDNFADIIRPNEISVIDYVDSDAEFYMNGVEISRVYKKIDRGAAVIGLQKRSDTKDFKGRKIAHDLGYGGDTTLKRASLYLAMNSGHLKIVKAKSWANERNPNGMEFTFKLVKGCKFVNVEEVIEEPQ